MQIGSGRKRGGAEFDHTKVYVKLSVYATGGAWPSCYRQNVKTLGSTREGSCCYYKAGNTITGRSLTQTGKVKGDIWHTISRETALEYVDSAGNCNQRDWTDQNMARELVSLFA